MLKLVVEFVKELPTVPNTWVIEVDNIDHARRLVKDIQHNGVLYNIIDRTFDVCKISYFGVYDIYVPKHNITCFKFR